MKTSGLLTASGDFKQKKDVIVIHPNDGFDLGLMTTKYQVQIVMGETPETFLKGGGKAVPGTLLLVNECPNGTIRLNLAQWQDLGKPRQLRLCCEADKVLIAKT